MLNDMETRRSSRMNVKVRRLLKGLRYISHVFGEGDQECKDEFKIGFPTDVKHVAHIGCNGPAAIAPTWMKEFKEANNGINESDTLVAFARTVQGINNSSTEESVGSTSRKVIKSDSKQPQTRRPKDGAKPPAADEVDPTKPHRLTTTRRRRKKKKNATIKKANAAGADDDASLRSSATSPCPNTSSAILTDKTGNLDKSSVYGSAHGSSEEDEDSDDSSYGTVTGERFVEEEVKVRRSRDL